jgi:hypothetical protein
MPQGDSLCSYLEEAKMSFFSFFCKFGEQEGRTDPAYVVAVDNSGREETVGKGCKRVNMVQIICTHVCK